MAKVNRDRMMQLIGKRLTITVQGEDGPIEKTGTLTGVSGRTAHLDGCDDVWLPSIHSIKEQPPL